MYIYMHIYTHKGCAVVICVPMQYIYSLPVPSLFIYTNSQSLAVRSLEPAKRSGRI